MKFTYPSLLLIALLLSSGSPSMAADTLPVGKERAPATRGEPGKATKKPAQPASEEVRPGDAGYDHLSAQVVYQVLLAEIALRRGQGELASQAYADLAVRTGDPQVMERAVEIAGHARRYDLAVAIARKWVEIEPTSERAQKMLTSTLVAANQLDDLAPHLIRLLEADKEQLAANLLGLNRLLARYPDRRAVFVLVDQVCVPFHGMAEAHYALALAASSAGEKERARAESRRAMELKPDWEMAALLEAQLLAQDFSAAEAIGAMQRFVERNPKAREVRLHLARALVGEKRYGDAKAQFDDLLNDYPNSPEIVYPVAILALQQNDIALAEKQLKHLVTLEFPDKKVAYYYLGQIAEENKRPVDAVNYYERVTAGEQYLPAQLRMASLLGEAGKLDEARSKLREASRKTPKDSVQLAIAEAQLLRDAKRVQEAFDLLHGDLLKQPEQPELLYETALLAERLGRLELMESYLRKLIAIKPDSVQAYNALGYSFAEHNMRLPEARELIEKALKLSPNDAFILDSLGWVHYRQGDLAVALSTLERAYGLRADPEIAAHLGEVLWMMGRKDEARSTWREALKKNPGNQVLDDVTRKFNP